MSNTDTPKRKPFMSTTAWVLICTALVVFVFAIVWMGETHEPDGSPLIENPGAVIVGLFSLLTMIATLVTQGLARSLAAIRNQVENSHEVNLRDDVDGKHVETTALMQVIRREFAAGFKRLDDGQAEIRADIRGIRRDGGRQDDRIHELEGRVHDLEK